MSDYIRDLQVVLAAREPLEFLPSWQEFRDRHYPGRSHSDAFLDVFVLIHTQVSPSQRWRLFFLFCQNRTTLAHADFVTHRTLFDAYRLISHLADMLGIQPGEIEAAATQMCDMAGADEAWQYDRILNWLIWRRGDRSAILERQQALLRAGAVDSLYGMQVHTLPPSRRTGKTMGDGIVNLSPAVTESAWKFYGFEARRSNDMVEIGAPFCFDTNHMEGAGLFCLLASCDVRGHMPAGGLTDARLKIELEMGIDAAAGRVLLGVGGPVPQDIGLAQPRTDYWLRDFNLAADGSFSGEVSLPPDPAAWIAMGRNPRSPPYFAYADAPLDQLLPAATNFFLALMQDEDPNPKQGYIRIGQVALIPAAP